VGFDPKPNCCGRREHRKEGLCPLVAAWFEWGEMGLRWAGREGAWEVVRRRSQGVATATGANEFCFCFCFSGGFADVDGSR